MPLSVAREFIAHDKPGKLPEHVRKRADGGASDLAARLGATGLMAGPQTTGDPDITPRQVFHDSGIFGTYQPFAQRVGGTEGEEVLLAAPRGEGDVILGQRASAVPISMPRASTYLIQRPQGIPGIESEMARGGLAGVKLDENVVPKAPAVPKVTAGLKPVGLHPTTWGERVEARGMMTGRGLAAGGAVGDSEDAGLCHYQLGGMMSPWTEHQDYENEIAMPHGGFVNSSIAGRTDRLPVVTGADSFVVPAAEISGLGQGNTLNGSRMLQMALRTGRYGTPIAHEAHAHTIPRPPSLPGEMHELAPESRGGPARDSHVLVAGGEWIIPPHDWVGRDPVDGQLYEHRGVRSLGDGDIEKGQRRLRNMVGVIRDHVLKTMRALPPPKS